VTPRDKAAKAAYDKARYLAMSESQRKAFLDKSRAAGKKWASQNKDKLAAKARRRWAKHHDRLLAEQRARQTKARYGISIEQRDEMAMQQRWCCAICGSMVRLFIDHDHANGAVRSLVCHHCNIGLGSFRDNPSALDSAVAYLRRHGK
jgi:hypothetical protein